MPSSSPGLGQRAGLSFPGDSNAITVGKTHLKALRSRVTRATGDLPLPEPVKEVILASTPPGSPRMTIDLDHCPPGEHEQGGGMNEMPVAQPEQIATAPLPSRRADPLRRWMVIILVLFVLLFGWTLIADRLTPYTSDASVRAFVVRIVPEVSGKVIEVGVRDNQIVRTGDLLYRIDPTPFRIAVERAEAKLAAAGQAVGASTAAVDAAQAQLVEEIAQRGNVREQAARVFELVRLGIYPRARGDQARSQLDEAEAQVKRAQATLEQARQELGPQGADNPQIREALAALEQARLDLARTTLLAPGDGVVSNLQLNIGQYAAAG